MLTTVSPAFFPSSLFWLLASPVTSLNLCLLTSFDSLMSLVGLPWGLTSLASLALLLSVPLVLL